MDYEKKYNEALERMRYIVIEPEDENMLQAIKETVFPELAESEDERIRKRIKGLIYHNDALLDKDDLLAWLEKKKEQKKDNPLEDFSKGYNAGYYHGCTDNKQKPAEWKDLTWKDIVELEGIINNVHYEFRNGIGQESFGKEVLEKFREYKGDKYLDEKEQKPTWSEEDEKMRNLAIEWAETMSGQFNFVDMDSTDFRKIINWLKSLRPNKQD